MVSRKSTVSILSQVCFRMLAGLFHRYVPAILEMLKRGKLGPLVPIPTISMVQVQHTTGIIPTDLLSKRDA